MRLTEYIKCIEGLIKEDGDLNVRGITINENEFHVMINNEWMKFNEYQDYKKEVVLKNRYDGLTIKSINLDEIYEYKLRY